MATVETIKHDDDSDNDEGTPLNPISSSNDDRDNTENAGSKQTMDLSKIKAEMLMSKRTLQWTSTKTPATSVGEALVREIDTKNANRNEASSFAKVCAGIRVVKITSRGHYRSRVLTISR
jgi:hypothetical protein